jgi:DNA-binding NarL/FixJ family response regulator
MIELKFDNLTARQRKLWTMRYRYGWRMKRIGLELGITSNGVSKMLARVHKRLGLPKCRISVIRTKPKRVSKRAFAAALRGSAYWMPTRDETG